jgi:uncharacterized glyoxalase superfamily protein PhnB
MHLHTYLNYGGNCEEAFRFYAQHLDGTITMLMHHGEQPGAQAGAPGLHGKVLHARMTVAAPRSPAPMSQRSVFSRCAAPTWHSP